MKTLLIGLTGLVVFTLAAKPPEAPKPQPLPVTSIGVAKTASQDCPPTVRVTGYYPTPSWHFDHWQMEQKGSTIELTPYGLNALKPDQMVAQVLMPYTLPKVLTGLKPGNYTIVAVGRNKRVSAPVTVKESAVEKGFPYVDTVTVPDTCAAGKAIKVCIDGNLPDSGWHPRPAEVKVGDGNVWIYPWGERKRGVFAAEVLKPHTWEVTLPTLQPGDYQVIVSGRDGDHTHRLTVTAP